MALSNRYDGYANGPDATAGLAFEVIHDSGDAAALPQPVEVAEAFAALLQAKGFTSITFYGTDTEQVTIYPPQQEG